MRLFDMRPTRGDKNKRLSRFGMLAKSLTAHTSRLCNADAKRLALPAVRLSGYHVTLAARCALTIVPFLWRRDIHIVPL